MRQERPDHMLQTTALVHDAYFKLIDQKHVRWQNRAHFFAIAAKAMRRILLDYAKSQRRIKRGGGLQKVSFSDEVILSPEKSAELIALDEALNELEKFDDRKYQVVCLRYFSGLTIEEIAEVLQIGESTVEGDWKLARAWLRREMGNGF
jgi:RNA polymerase sigma factor (TIGR02999 family)